MRASDWIAVVAAVIAVLAAIASWLQVRHAKTQAKAAKESLRLQEKIWQDASQPYVYADICSDPRNGQMLLIVIENTGKTVATNVRVKFDPPLESATDKYEKVAQKKTFTDGIPALPPGGRVTHYLDIGHALAGSSLPKTYRVIVTGEGPLGPLETLEYYLDLDALLLQGPALAQGSLYDLTRAIKKLTDKMK